MKNKKIEKLEGPRAKVISTRVISGPTTQKGMYHSFLRSDHWKGLRRRKLRSQGQCCICLTREHLCIHHDGYANVYKPKPKKALKNTYVLCNGCHNAVHQVQKERGLKWEETGPIIQEFKEEATRVRQMERERIEEFNEASKDF